MRVVSSDNKITIYICIKDVVDINEYVKKLIIKLKRKYKINVSGFYQVNIYKNSKIGMIIDMIREDDIYGFNDIVDLKIKIYDDCGIYLSFDDYYFDDEKNICILDGKYYLNVNELSDDDFLLMTEFCNYVYGDDFYYIEEKISNIKKYK